jgi:hypothetical protein
MQPEAPQEEASPMAAEQVEFRVVLRGVRLEPSMEKTLCQEIRNTILQELSQRKHGGELRVTSFGEQTRARPLLGESRLVGMVVTSASES